MDINFDEIDILTIGYTENTVLFVDDEENILTSLKRGLRREGYKKLFASSGEEALDLLRGNSVSVIVSDMRMPGMNGLELLKRIKNDYPDTVRVVLSAYTQLPQVLASVNQADVFKFITKPWDLENGLKKILRDALDFYNINIENKRLRQLVEDGGLSLPAASSQGQAHEIRKDFKHFIEVSAKLNEYVFDITQENLVKSGDPLEIKTAVHALTQIYRSLEDVFPLEEKEMYLSAFADKINAMAFEIFNKGMQNDASASTKHLRFLGIDQMTETYRFAFDLIQFVFRHIFENVFEISEGNVFNVAVRVASNEGFGHANTSRIVLLLEEAAIFHLQNSIRQRAVIYMLNTLLGQIGGGVKLAQHDRKVVVIVEFVLESVDS